MLVLVSQRKGKNFSFRNIVRYIYIYIERERERYYWTCPNRLILHIKVNAWKLQEYVAASKLQTGTNSALGQKKGSGCLPAGIDLKLLHEGLSPCPNFEF